MKKKLKLYYHGGSNNHGCEAIVRCTGKMVRGDMEKMLFSFSPEQDIACGLDEIYTVLPMLKYNAKNLPLRLAKKLRAMTDLSYSNIYHPALFEGSDADVAVSIGGDSYGYEDSIVGLMKTHDLIYRNGQRTVLWGCSVEPDLLTSSDVVEDMKKYDLITARESITAEALSRAGVRKNVQLFPDPAFQLDTCFLPLPEGFIEGKTVGLNISPMVIKSEEVPGVTLEGTKALIQHIIDNTDFQVALIPHVIWDGSDDRTVLNEVFQYFKNTGRVVMIENHNCMELKGYIARCRMFIGARTHATIAAYSSCVPTVVIGYSVKSRGIAKDLFGTHEKYVIPVQNLRGSGQFIEAFEWLKEQENAIRSHLEKIMPAYKAKALGAGKEILKLLGEAVEG